MIPGNIKNKIKELEKLRVENTNATIYWFEPKTNTLYIPISETDFNSMFSDCSFQSVDLCIENRIKQAANMFSSCSNLKNIIFTKKLNLSEVNSLYGLFSNCLSLSYFDFKNVILSNKLNCFMYIFNNCVCLCEVNFGNNFPSENIKNMDFAFYKCMSLKKIYWKERQPFDNLESLKAAFIKCNRLKELDLRGVYFNKIKDSENAFFATNSNLNVLVNNTFKKEMV